MKVGLLGDTHGNGKWILHALEQFAQAGLRTIIQVGDLGVWPGPRAGKMWNQVDKVLELNEQTILVAPGNHEDYDRIARLKLREDGWLQFRDHILLAPRGHRTELGGRSLVWLGGAGSVDRTWRKHHQEVAREKIWWHQEEITYADVDRTVAGGRAEVMVAHDAPHGVPYISRRLATKVNSFKAEDVLYANTVRSKFTEAFDAVQPQLLLHGHYHFAVDQVVEFDGFTTHVFGLADDDNPLSLGVLDLETLVPSFLGARD